MCSSLPGGDDAAALHLYVGRSEGNTVSNIFCQVFVLKFGQGLNIRRYVSETTLFIA